MNDKFLRYCGQLALILLCSVKALGQDYVHTSYWYVLDTSRVLTVDAVKVLQPEHFSVYKGAALNASYSEGAVWIKADKSVFGKATDLVIENAHLDTIRIFQFSGRDSLLKVSLLGDAFPFSVRNYHFKYPNEAIDPQTETIYMQVYSNGPLLVPIVYFDHGNLLNYSINSQRIYYFYAGILFLALVIYLFLYRSLKESNYLFYALSVLACGLVSGLDHGYLFQLLWPDWPLINRAVPSIYSLMVFGVVFTERFLDIRKSSLILYRFYLLLYAVHLLIVVFNVIGSYSLAMYTITLLWVFIPPFLMVVSIYFYVKKKLYEARYLIWAWSFLLLSILAYTLGVSNIIPFQRDSSVVLIMGSGLEVIFLFLAVVKRYELLKREKSELLEKQNKILERELRIRTTEIVRKNRFLEKQNMELEILKNQADLHRELIEGQNKVLKDKKNSLEELVGLKTRHLQDANSALEERNKRFEQFTFIAAHNLRGPVATLKGICSIQKRNLERNEPVELIPEAGETVDKLDAIIKELIFILDLPSDAELLREKTDIGKIVCEAASAYRGEIEKKEGALHVSIEADKLPPVETVPVYIENIVSNLIANAIRFGRSSEALVVSVECTREPAYILINVRDNGRGINLQKHKNRIFRPFQRFHQDSGKGLGLFIIKSQAEAIGASVAVSENPEGGLCFSVAVPIEA